MNMYLFNSAHSPPVRMDDVMTSLIFNRFAGSLISSRCSLVDLTAGINNTKAPSHLIVSVCLSSLILSRLSLSCLKGVRRLKLPI